MTYLTPCADPANDPNDWFISKDGKQYPDDELLTQADVDDVLAKVKETLGPADEGYVEAVDQGLEDAEAEALKAQLTKRRHAKDKCYTHCLIRTQCLQRALDWRVEHGTWGGYYPEELRILTREIDARRKRAEAREKARREAAEAAEASQTEGVD